MNDPRPLILRRGPRLVAQAALYLAFAGALGAQVGPDTLFSVKLPDPRDTELAGVPEPAFPHFQYVRAFHAGDDVYVALDPTRFPGIAGVAADLWIVADRDAAGWELDPVLVDVRGEEQSVTFGADLVSSTFLVDDSATLSAQTTGFGVGYDVVIDRDLDGVLSPGDFIDGRGELGGFYVVVDPVAPGPRGVTEIEYSGGAFLGQNTFFPSFLDKQDVLPLVVVAHGNGHDYRWYDHIAEHLASHGFIVMSHENNTQPGTEAASTATLTNIDYLLDNLDVISGGALVDHVDSDSIVLIGHSRGGEGVVRAYNRLATGNYVSPNFEAADVRLVTAMAPVTFLDPVDSDPGAVPFQLIYGAADADVTGSPGCCNSKPFGLYERSVGDRLAVYIQGAGHADLHNGGGFCWCTGPDLIGPEATHDLLRGYLLPSIHTTVFGNEAGKDYWTRSFEDFAPQGIGPEIIVAKDFRQSRAGEVFVIDDFETNPDPATSSSGGLVTTDLLNVFEGFLEDTDSTFVYSVNVPMNGMTRFADFGDAFRGVVFEWTQAASGFYEQEIVLDERDLSDDAFLSFRACQGTRHPETDALDAPLSFAVSLRHASGAISTIRIDNYGELTRTYERTGAGPGFGWANEFATFRVRLTDFLHDAALPDLTDIEAVRFDFGASFGSDRGRIGMDDIEILGGAL